MGGERNRRTGEKERVELLKLQTPSIQPVGGVSCRAGGRACVCFLKLRPPASCFHGPFWVFDLYLSQPPWVRSEERALPVTRRPRQERERAGRRKKLPPPPPVLLAFRLYFFCYSILSSPSSVLSPPTASPAPPFPLRFLLFPLSPLLPRAPVLGGLR